MVKINHFFYKVLEIPVLNDYLNHVEIQVNESKISLVLKEIKIKKV